MTDELVTDNTAAERFEIHVDGDLAGYAVYERSHPEGSAPTIALTHTVVETRYEGQGIGSALARGAMDAARTAGEGVLPFCPFVRSWIQRHPAYLDLVPEDRRAALVTGPRG